MYTGVKVFTATKAKEREELGDAVTQWLKDHRVEIINTEVRQSSDQEYHCLSIVLFYRDKPA
ncbi:MAG: hypothetical protein HY904_04520 [Deltaproteobacteria bacterium]|nr:hypothetical protein [Deltaproteobacteria bacterium]